jgi:hypothetical protein
LSDKRAVYVADGPTGIRQLQAIYAQEFSQLPGYHFKMILWHTLPVALMCILRSMLKRLQSPS